MSSRMATVTGTITNNAGILCSLAVLGTYAGIAGHAGAQSPPLDVNRLFSIATTVNLMSTPLSILGKPYFNRMMNMALTYATYPGQYTPSLFAGYASILRLQTFLRLRETEAVSSETGKDDCTITMTDASFSWTPDAKPFLHDLTLNIQPGKLHMCIGTIAAV